MRTRVFLMFAFIGLAFSAFSQIVPQKADSSGAVRRVRTKANVPANQGEKTRRGSQIVNDSTQNIYGPNTTRWTTEREMFTAKTNFRPLDTSINNYHRWTFVQKSANLYHDLGNNGTALNPVFPLISSNIGATAGFMAYAPYWNSEQELKLFDTKSPYTRMALVWGGQGRAATKVEYSRNINKKWNITVNFRPILTDKQILRQGRADRNVISYYYDVYTHYTTKDERYKIVAAYQRIRHRVIENGGIQVTSLNAEKQYSDYFGTDVSPFLTKAQSFEQHNKFHVFHQYNIKKVQAYHVMDLETQVNWYRDNLSVEPATYYDYKRIDTATVADSTRFRTFSNQFGIKGQIGKKNNIFYNGWVKFRSYNYYNKYVRNDTLNVPGRALEKYIGGEVQYALDSVQHITGLIEVLDGGYSRIESTGHMKWFDFNAIHRVSKPTMLQTGYAGHFDTWNNDFKPVESIFFSAFPKVKLGPFYISPGASLTSFRNYIYFAKVHFGENVQTVLPQQTSSFISYAQPQVNAEIRFLKKLFFRPQFIYTEQLSDPENVVRMPTLFANGQLAYEGDLFKHAVQVQIGVDVHWHSSYYAMGYDPATQTFFNQDSFKQPASSYYLADVFINGKIKHGRFFIKYHNLAQKFLGVGYMPTPTYRGVPSILDFGFEIMLFD